MKVKCPSCAYQEDLPEDYIGKNISCVNCGHEYVVGTVFVLRHKLFNGTEIGCPYCGTLLLATKEALNRYVRCSSCDQKFLIADNLKKEKKTQTEAPTATQTKQADKETNSTRKGRKAAIICLASLLILVSILIPAIIFLSTFSNDPVYQYTLSQLSNLPYSDTNIRDGKLYYYDENAANHLEIVSITKGKFFGILEPEGVLAIRFNYDRSHSTFFIQMKTHGYHDGETLPSMVLIADGTYTYAATFGNLRTVRRFRRVRRK